MQERSRVDVVPEKKGESSQKKSFHIDKKCSRFERGWLMGWNGHKLKTERKKGWGALIKAADNVLEG